MNTPETKWRLICWNVAGWPTHGYERLVDEGAHPVLEDSRTEVPGFRRISKCAAHLRNGNFDLACLQEVWNGEDRKKLQDGWSEHWSPDGGDSSSGVRSSSGLLILADEEPEQKDQLFYDSFGPKQGDFLVHKGAAFARWPFGWVCNTHLDAGRDAGSREAREKQITNKLIPKLLECRQSKPFVLVGDLNLKPGDGDDENLLNILTARTGAVVIARDGKDFVLASPELRVTPLRHPDPENGLSDHDPICVEIAWF